MKACEEAVDLHQHLVSENRLGLRLDLAAISQDPSGQHMEVLRSALTGMADGSLEAAASANKKAP